MRIDIHFPIFAYLISNQEYYIFYHRLYTSPKDWAFYNTLSSTQTYEKVMKNNVDLQLSFNSWDISLQKTLNTSKSALFADSDFLDVWGQKLSKQAKDLPCIVRL